MKKLKIVFVLCCFFGFQLPCYGTPKSELEIRIDNTLSSIMDLTVNKQFGDAFVELKNFCNEDWKVLQNTDDRETLYFKFHLFMVCDLESLFFSIISDLKNVFNDAYVSWCINRRRVTVLEISSASDANLGRFLRKEIYSRIIYQLNMFVVSFGLIFPKTRGKIKTVVNMLENKGTITEDEIIRYEEKRDEIKNEFVLNFLLPDDMNRLNLQLRDQPVFFDKVVVANLYKNKILKRAFPDGINLKDRWMYVSAIFHWMMCDGIKTFFTDDQFDRVAIGRTTFYISSPLFSIKIIRGGGYIRTRSLMSCEEESLFVAMSNGKLDEEQVIEIFPEVGGTSYLYMEKSEEEESLVTTNLLSRDRIEDDEGNNEYEGDNEEAGLEEEKHEEKQVVEVVSCFGCRCRSKRIK